MYCQSKKRSRQDAFGNDEEPNIIMMGHESKKMRKVTDVESYLTGL